MGNVQLAEGGMLRLEKHAGLNRYFTDFFAFVEDSTTSCAQAAQQRQQITVNDVESADIFDDASRHAILQAGSRTAHRPGEQRGQCGALAELAPPHCRPRRPGTPPLHRPQSPLTVVCRASGESVCKP
jgi:hypothetical protein